MEWVSRWTRDPAGLTHPDNIDSIDWPKGTVKNLDLEGARHSGLGGAGLSRLMGLGYTSGGGERG